MAHRQLPRPSVPYRNGVPEPVSIPPAARDAILDWYDQRGRTLPFRRTSDPYAVLVSETMAQQTQAARAGEAWLRFVERFPNVQALAAASPADVLREWQGLGYNRRALNLWRAARRIVEAHDGMVPPDLRSLQALPGVGPYTARAVAAIAFGRPVGAVDTNVRRVLSRIVAGAAAALPAPELQQLANAVVPPDRPADWTHALMDVGATLCRPRRPDCADCPARSWCRFAELASVDVEGATRTSPTTSARASPAPFATTSRWLRGRIVERLRGAGVGEWMAFDGSIGAHERPAIDRALQGLAKDGLVEIRGEGLHDREARLPLGD